MNFGDSSHKTVEMPDCFRVFGPKRAPLSRNRVKDMGLVKNELAIAKKVETSILFFWLLSVYSIKSVLLKHLD